MKEVCFMRMDISSLPPHYQRQVAEKLKAQCGNSKTTPATTNTNPPVTAPEASTKTNKYRNETALGPGGLKFKSKRELKRYNELMLLLNAGEITDLKLQPQYTLLESYYKPDGTPVKRMRYTADFSYIKNGQLIVEDVKSTATKTEAYQLRKNMMLDRYSIIITEIME